jgi:hypothetical protein
MYTQNPLQISKLEYRLADENNKFPAIYHVTDIDIMEIFCRRNCDYFTVNGVVYENVGSSLEDDRYVIYIQVVPNEKPYPDAPLFRKLGIEVRLFTEVGERKEIEYIDCYSHQEVMAYLDNTYLYLNKTEYERTSAELDQDRRVYVLYVKPTGIELA